MSDLFTRIYVDVPYTLANLYPFCFCTELASRTLFIWMMQDGVVHEAEPRSSYVEGARDVAVLEAMLESGAKQGSSIQVKRF